MKNDKQLALVDIGSNTIRLVIFSCDRYYNVAELQNIKVPARLATYLQEDGTMAQEGIDVLVTTLVNFVKVIDRFNVDSTFFIATAAVRLSKNVDDIVDEVEEATGLPLQVLSGEEEAFYGNYAVRHTMSFKRGVTVDIGGGSTELVLYSRDKREETISLPFGAVTLKDRFFADKDHNDSKAVKKAKNFIKDQLSQIDWLADCQLPIIGIGGSIRNIGEVHQRANNYPIAGIHGYRMSVKDINETLDIFCSRSMDDLQDLDGLSKERSDTIIPANLVFDQILEVSGSDNLYISSRGLREGYIIHRLNASENNPYSLDHIRSQTIVRTARKYKVSSYAVNQRLIIADSLVQEFKKNKVLDLTPREMELMYYGGILYYLGKYIEDDGWSQHTFYILSNISLYGFNQKERVAIALIASFKNKSLFKQYSEDFQSWFTSVELERLLYIGGIMKLSEALNDSQVNVIKDVKLTKKDSGKWELYITYSGNLIAEEYRANKQKNHIERFLDDDLEVYFDWNVN